ncbi:MAG: relaxase/mobilization nuclease domain-containing protein [Pseudomonadota bacterium]
MILKGSQRAGAKQLSMHLMNDRDNDHITLYHVRGFVALDLHGALAETYAISKGTKCQQYLFSLSLNPPKDVMAGEDVFLQAIEKAEVKLGLNGQPRAIIFHEKEGRRHAHVVWSRIDAETMTAINLPHFKRKLTDLSRELYLEHDWTLPDGLRRDGGKSPLNFTLDQWQQAKRLKLDPREIKQSFMDAWQYSDNAKAFKHALEDKGYFLAKGDRRGYVAVDIHGEIFSVPKWIGIKTKEVRQKLGDPEQLPSLANIKKEISRKVTDKIKGFIDDVDHKHTQDFKPLHEVRSQMVANHRMQRAKLRRAQNKRWIEESQKRAQRFRTGLVGLWDKLTGRANTIQKINERQAWKGLKRDQAQRDRLIEIQMAKRQGLQHQIDALRRKHAQNRKILTREIAQAMRMADHRHETGRTQRRTREQDHSKSIYRGPSL